MGASDLKTEWKKLSQEALEDRRRGKRINLRFEIQVSGTDAKGADFRMGTHTQDISENGCCFASSKEMFKGELVRLGVIRRTASGAMEVKNPLRFRIQWVTLEKSMWVVGAEMLEVAKPWGVSFPPKSAVSKFS
jgi:hypothetical protein